jgi:LmbE family N-acetylglucosaminyl deacetylase
LIVVLMIIAISAHLYWLKQINGDEVFQTDTYLDQEPNKTALIVVAHDDDAIGCAGTVTELTKKGWKIHFLTFYGNYRKEDNPMRKAEVNRVAQIQQLATVSLVDLSMQKSDTVKAPWLPIPYSLFEERMYVDSVKQIIEDAIILHQPSVVFTLDNVIGGYGHPEHVCVSQCVVDVCSDNSKIETFSVKNIYQAVFTKTLNENVLKNNPAFIAAKNVYAAEGSPTPTVEINIRNSSSEKKQIMLAYESQKRNLKKIWPYYYLYPHWVYFSIFDKEYFRVLKVSDLTN